MSTNADLLNESLRRKLKAKERELRVNNATILTCAASGNVKGRKSAEAAVRRNEKSVALLTSKLFCSHDFAVFTGIGQFSAIYCHKCRSSTAVK